MRRIYFFMVVLPAILLIGCATSSPKLNFMTTANKELASDAVDYLQGEIENQGCEAIEKIQTTPLVLGATNNIEYWVVSGCGRVFKYELTFATNGSTFSAKQRK